MDEFARMIYEQWAKAQMDRDLYLSLIHILYGRHDGYYTIPYTNYIPILVAAVQVQQREIDQLKRLVGKEVQDV